MNKASEKQSLFAPPEKSSNKGPWIFMGVTFLLLAVVYVIDNDKGKEAVFRFFHLADEILPMLVLVFALMVLLNIFLKTSTLVKYMGKGSGVKGWLVAIVTGILSLGAIYMWFPLLRDMMDRGVKPGLVSVFLYNRGIKVPWLPLMVVYFGLKYVIVLTVVTVMVSVFQGWIIDFLYKTDSTSYRQK